MISKTNEGYFVKSMEGQNLGGPYKTLAEAMKRLKQVEGFKKMDQKQPMNGAPMPKKGMM